MSRSNIEYGLKSQSEIGTATISVRAEETHQSGLIIARMVGKLSFLIDPDHVRVPKGLVLPSRQETEWLSEMPNGDMEKAEKKVSTLQTLESCLFQAAISLHETMPTTGVDFETNDDAPNDEQNVIRVTVVRVASELARREYKNATKYTSPEQFGLYL